MCNILSDTVYLILFRCFSYVGRIGGRQTITLGPRCDQKGVVMHEIFHALGRWHEQNRPDRNLHVTINTDNIRPGVLMFAVWIVYKKNS